MKSFLTKIAIAVVVFAMIAIAFFWMGSELKKISRERDMYARNNIALLSDVEVYRTKDSLSAARAEALELTVRDYQRFRAEDAALIKTLKAKNRDLTAINSVQSQTILTLSSIPKDTIIIRDSIQIPAIRVVCRDPWYDFEGVLTKDSFTGKLHNRDSLVVVETVQYKRFLGFLWKTKEVKSRQVDVVSKNPHTNISDVELIIINK